MTQMFYKKADGVLLCFDINDRKTFEKVGFWIDSLYEHGDPSTPRVIIGNNKVDDSDQKEVTYEEAMSFAKSLGYNYYET